MPDTDPFHLQCFVDAQSSVYPEARAELAAGHKRTHWMWFIFPQIQGLGSSPTAQRYAIADRAEASAYLAHPVLGPRLRECTALTIAAADRRPGTTADDIFPYPDGLKFHSSVTLFAETAQSPEDRQHFTDALNRFFAGRADAATLSRL